MLRKTLIDALLILSWISSPAAVGIFLHIIVALDERQIRLLQTLLQDFVHGERHGLARRHTHHTGGDTLVESRGTLRLEHVLGDDHDPAHGGLPGLSGLPLETSLDGVNGGVGEGTHGTGEQSDDGGLVRGKLFVAVFGLDALQSRLELRVGREVGGLVGTLSEGGQRHTAVQDAESFLPDDGEESMGSATVLGGVGGIGQTVVLGLQTDLNHFHGVDNGHSFRHTSGKTS